MKPRNIVTHFVIVKFRALVNMMPKRPGKVAHETLADTLGDAKPETLVDIL